MGTCTLRGRRRCAFGTARVVPDLKPRAARTGVFRGLVYLYRSKHCALLLTVLSRARRLTSARLREIARDAARVRWGGLSDGLRSLFWAHPSTFESLRLNADFDLILYQVLAYGNVEQRSWLIKRCGLEAVRAWLRKRRGGGVPASRLSEWFDKATIRRWQRGNPGAAIWENR
jgi:hypothetical protein